MAVFVATTTAISGKMIGTDFSNTATSSLFSDSADATDEHIRSKLSRRYDVSSDYFQTTTAAPPMLQEVGNWYCMGLMYEQLGRGSKEQFARSDRFLKRADKTLDALADKKTNLFDSTGSIVTPSTATHPGVKSAQTDYTPTFDEDSPLNWEVDRDKLEDIESNRD